MSDSSKTGSAANVLVAISSITIMAIYAISHGVNGSIVYAAIVGVAGLGGYQLSRENKG